MLSQTVEPNTTNNHGLKYGYWGRLRGRGSARCIWSFKLSFLARRGCRHCVFVLQERVPLCPTHPSILSKRSWEETGNNWPTDQVKVGDGNALVGKKNILILDNSCTEEGSPEYKENLSLFRVISHFFDLSK